MIFFFKRRTKLFYLADLLRQSGRPRPLHFDPNQHKILNSELKHLYTAVTRARVNVWIFDQDAEKRAPMFEYFKARKLVKFASISENEESKGAYFRLTFLMMLNMFI